MPAAQEPVVSVVVATYNRASRLARLVSALAGQRGELAFEVVVVDDASKDDTWAELQRLTATAPFPLRALHLDRNRGPSRARNVGWRATAAPLVAFTDDDCEPMPGWLATLVAAAAEADVVQGATFPDPDDYHSRRGPFSYTLKVTTASPWYETCNMAYRRSWLERLDGFDEAYRHPAGEDTDLGWRALEAGARMVFAPAAAVVHDVHPLKFRDRLRDVHRWEGVVGAVGRHPGLRTALWWHWFWKASHPPALVAALGLVAAVIVAVAAPDREVLALALAAGACGQYGLFRVLVRRLPGRLRSLPAIPLALLVDWAEIAVMARASLRYRTLVL